MAYSNDEKRNSVYVRIYFKTYCIFFFLIEFFSFRLYVFHFGIFPMA